MRLSEKGPTSEKYDQKCTFLSRYEVFGLVLGRMYITDTTIPNMRAFHQRKVLFQLIFIDFSLLLGAKMIKNQFFEDIS